MNVAAILTPDPVALSVHDSLDRAIELMEDQGVRHLPVLDGARVVGVISDRDLLRATGWLPPAHLRALEVPEIRAGDIMRAPAVTVAPAQGIRAALDPMLERRLGCLPVLEGGRLVGMVSELDLLRAYVDARNDGRLPAHADPSIERFMTRAVRTIEPDASGDEAAAELREHGLRHLPVLRGHELVGIVSERDVFRERGRGRLELTLVEELMTTDPLTAHPEERLSSVALILSAAKISALPVLERNRLVGIVSLRDVLAPCGQALQALS